jgi:hypothetical protein
MRHVGFLQSAPFLNAPRVLFCGVERCRPHRVVDYHITHMPALVSESFSPRHGACDGRWRIISYPWLMVFQRCTPLFEKEKSIAVVEKVSKAAGIGACGLVMTDARSRLVQNDKAEFPQCHSEVDVDAVHRIKLLIKAAD